MQIINVKKYSVYINNNFIFKLYNFKDLILFNCSESLQSYLINKNLKINNLSKIIITNLNINNISGLLGLLSSLHSIGRIKDLHIYGPKGLDAYLDLGKKYARTNFRYILYIHILHNGLMINHYKYRIYTFFDNYHFTFTLISSEIFGKFIMNKAILNYLYPSSLFSNLKQGSIFLLPDGLILDGINFTNDSYEGKICSMMLNKYYCRYSVLNNKEFVILLYE